MRALILKGRQQGCSTYVAARYYHKATHEYGSKAYILTHEDPATQNLFDMVKRYQDNCPEEFRPSTGAANAKELSFDRLDGGYRVGTAGTKGTGRSATIQLFHGSEVGFWAYADTHIAGVLQTVPDAPGTEVILESTANGVGGTFHKMWRDAETCAGDFIAIFVPGTGRKSMAAPVLADFALDAEERIYADLYGLSPNRSPGGARRSPSWRPGPLHAVIPGDCRRGVPEHRTGFVYPASAHCQGPQRQSTSPPDRSSSVSIRLGRVTSRHSMARRGGRRLMRDDSKERGQHGQPRTKEVKAKWRLTTAPDGLQLSRFGRA